jgi:NAD(P)-dependent dehydrogenase (short-subunit alcohol dehydrogenase family)
MKNIVIIGAGKGIGLATARLLSQGNQVYAFSRSESADLDELKQSLSHEGDNSTDDTSPTFKMMEDGTDTTSREEVAQLAARQEKFILSLTSS